MGQKLGGFAPGTTLVTVPTVFGNITANSYAAPHFQNFLSDLQAAGYNVTTLYSYSPRDIAGTDTLSEHAFGNAIDINPGANPVSYNGVVTDLPPNIRYIAAKMISFGEAIVAALKKTRCTLNITLAQ